MKAVVFVLCVFFKMMLIVSCFNNGNVSTTADIQKVNIPIEHNVPSLHFPVGMTDDYIVYNTIDESEIVIFWKYDIKSSKSIEIGRIEKARMWSGSFILLDNKLFFTMGMIDEKSIHFMIDVEKGGVTELSEDKEAHPLVYYSVVDEERYIKHIIGRNADDEEISYIALGNIDGTTETIIANQYPNPNKAGGTILNAKYFDGIIYTLEFRETEDTFKHYLCTYNLSGEELSVEYISLLGDFLNTPDEIGETYLPWEMEVWDNYYYVRTLGRTQIVLKKENNEYKKIIPISRDTYTDDDIQIVRRNSLITKDETEFLFYNSNTRKFHIFDSETESITELNIDDTMNEEYFRYHFTDGKRLIYINDNNDVYLYKYN
ncbi:MAG: hypothetical protein FWH14_07735 [Oscillospiraceae bacterium]|nr:hypothetical protein [Oscillospiraceae bacterium]